MSQTIYNFLRREIKNDIKLPYSLWGKVTEVDTTNKTCKVDPVGSRPLLVHIQLSPVKNPDSGVWMIPQVGSQVCVAFTGENTGYVSLFSKIDEIHVENSDFSFVINENGITMNGGNNGGLTIISDLVNRLNSIENQFNNLRSDYQLHTHGGAVAAPTTNTSSSLTNTQASDIENTDVKH